MQDWRTLSLTEMLLRVGVAIAFLYPPINAIFDPYAWIGYFPPFMLSIAGAHDVLLLHLFGIVEVAIALWILLARNIRIPSIIATLLLVAIVAANLKQFPILFRDLSIALMAATLAFKRPKPRHD